MFNQNDANPESNNAGSSQQMVCSSYADNNGIANARCYDSHDVHYHFPPKVKTLAELEVYGQFPRQTQHFVERLDIMDKLEKSLEQENKSVVLTVLRGLGGIGKTELAVHYSQSEISKKRYEFRAYFNAENKEQLEREYIDLGYELDIFKNHHKTPEQKIQAVAQYLNKPTNKGWLLVYDSAPDYGTIAEYLPTEGGSVLITSRQTTWPGVTAVDVTLMDQTQARELILKQSGLAQRNDYDCKTEQSILNELIEELGGLPLALAQAAAYIQINFTDSLQQKPITRYLKNYKDNKKEYLSDKSLQDAYGKKAHESVYITFDMNFKALHKKYPDSLKLLYQCSLLASTVIPADVIKESLRMPNQIEKLVWESRTVEDDFYKLLRPLNSYSLLSSDRNSNTLTLHRLIKEILRIRFNELELSERELLWEEVALSLYENFKERSLDMTEVRRRIGLMQHVQAIIEVFDKFEISTQQELVIKTGSCVKNLVQLAKVLDSELNDMSYCVLGETVRAIRHWESQDLYSESWQVAIRLSNLGGGYGNLGNFSKAKEFLQDALKMMLKLHYGKNYFGNKIEQMRTALRMLRELHRRKECWQESNTVDTLHRLSTVYCALESLNISKWLLENILQIQEAQHGNDLLRFASMKADLGIVYYKLGNFTVSKELLERALEIQESCYGNNHWEVANTLSYLGTIYAGTYDLDTSEHYLKRALEIQESHYGNNHFKVAITLNYLGFIYALSYNFEKSKESCERALKIQIVHYGSSHWRVGNTYVALGKAYAELENFTESEKHLVTGLDIQKAHYGDDNWRVLDTLNTLKSVRELKQLASLEITEEKAEDCDALTYTADCRPSSIEMGDGAELIQASSASRLLPLASLVSVVRSGIDLVTWSFIASPSFKLEAATPSVQSSCSPEQDSLMAMPENVNYQLGDNLDAKPMEVDGSDISCQPGFYGEDKVPALECSNEHFKAQVFLKTGEGTALLPEAESSCIGEDCLLNGDTYDQSTCHPVEYFGQPSVCCEGEKTHLIYTPRIANPFFETLNANLLLGTVLLHAAKQGYDFVMGVEENESAISQENSDVIATDSADVQQLFKELREELSDIQLLITQQNKDASKGFPWARDTLEFHSERLAKLEAESSVAVSHLEDIKLDIEHLKADIQAYPAIISQTPSTQTMPPINPTNVSDLETVGMFASSNLSALGYMQQTSAQQQPLLQVEPVPISQGAIHPTVL